MVKIGVKKLHPDAVLPKFQTEGSAGADVYLVEDVFPEPGQTTIHIPLGFALEIPPGYEVQIRPRSGLAYKFGVTLTNAVGTIDSDYKNEVGVLISSFSELIPSFRKGERIAQLVVQKLIPTYYEEIVDFTPDLTPKDQEQWDIAVDRASKKFYQKRTGGFGSTGK